MKLYESESPKEWAILVGVQENKGDDAVKSLKELAELAETAGAMTAGTLIQNREKIHPGTYLGPGKVEELKELLYSVDADCVICDDELSPAQYIALDEALECKIMDRTMVILDIFATRANTKEGKIQVELAQLKYRSARLVGMRRSLSRLGGGIGTRGPGEKKLEMDRRVIRQRIAQLQQELEKVEKHRDLLRERRKKNNQIMAALVGYTNAGKSSLLNVLTGANVLEEDKLFATLDPTTRILELPGQQQILLTDTVGFIRKLPHHLVQAFRSTLEEARYADIIIHVVDSSNPNRDDQMETVYETLRDLGVEGKKIVTLFNKQDALEDEEILKDTRADRTLRVSARSGEGLEEFRNLLNELLHEDQIYIERVFLYEEAGRIQMIRGKGELLSEEYLPEGIMVKAWVSEKIFKQL